MITTSKQRAYLDASKAQKIEDLCKWIASNCDHPIGWDQLIFQSGMQHKQIIELFKLHKKQTPMAFVRQARLLKRNRDNKSPQTELFGIDGDMLRK